MEDNPRVLIIEDQDVLRAMLFTILRHQPLDVDTAVSAETAMAKVEQCEYALILIDLDLENDEAASFLTRFRASRPEAKTFIIAVRDPNTEMTVEAGMVSAMLSKPLEIDTLADVCRECAIVVPPPENQQGCPPAESDIRASLEGGPMIAN